MILRFDQYTQEVKEIEERLRQLSLAFTKEQAIDFTLQLKEGKDLIKGKVAIMNYLDQLQSELHTWYYCDC